MEYVKATEKDLEQIAILVRDTIQEIYPKYYPKEVVDFFCELHCRENIFEDIKRLWEQVVIRIIILQGYM